tara:strand:- start:26088 stop:27110 length:1023 start_codon:yes stop_codon:yes gene_type:complete
MNKEEEQLKTDNEVEEGQKMVLLEITSEGCMGWRDGADSMQSIDFFSEQVPKEIYDLLVIGKPLEASEIPSLIEAFPTGNGETTKLSVWRGKTFEGQSEIDVDNELIIEELLSATRYDEFFNSYGLKAMSPKEIRDIVAEDFHFCEINEVDVGCFNDTDGTSAWIAEKGFTFIFNEVGLSDESLWDYEGIWKGGWRIGNPRKVFTADNLVVEENENGYFALRQVGFYNKPKYELHDEIMDWFDSQESICEFLQETPDQDYEEDEAPKGGFPSIDGFRFQFIDYAESKFNSVEEFREAVNELTGFENKLLWMIEIIQEGQSETHWKDWEWLKPIIKNYSTS